MDALEEARLIVLRRMYFHYLHYLYLSSALWCDDASYILTALDALREEE